MLITSKQNDKIKTTAKLQSKKYRDREQLFLVEGYYPLSLALKNAYPIKEVFVCEELLRDKFDNETVLKALQEKNIPITNVSKDVYLKLSDYESPEGLIAVAPQRVRTLKEFTATENGLYVVAESVEKLSTLGNLIRLADNAGATLILCDSRADVYNPHVIRTSLGTFFCVDILETTTDEALVWFKDNTIQTVATSPHAKQSYSDVDMTKPTAIILGTEHGGLSDIWLQKSDIQVLIPMLGQAESLSVSASAAVMLYEAVRQRH